METNYASAIINQLAYDIVIALIPTRPRGDSRSDAADIARLIRDRLRRYDFVRLERLEP